MRYGGPLQGEGTPQKCRNSSTYFRRIDDKNNFVYSVNKDILEIKSCKGHYEE
ncbi:MAG: type II toxin-antitoxin system YoeB family toxin [Selenomonadaceae bacterium]|nr:type II toxin-antitoxin system YoeB family toxin [Selenomonadaceae bacterium]